MRLLWAVDHGLQRRSKRMAATLGVTGPQRLVIRIVGRFPGISAGRLASILHLHPSTLTGILRRLERGGCSRDGRIRGTAAGPSWACPPQGGASTWRHPGPSSR